MKINRHITVMALLWGCCQSLNGAAENGWEVVEMIETAGLSVLGNDMGQLLSQ